ncbi:hypothetical protein Pmgp_02719 [Pelotomaculum propionicicum]|uniref:Uncharacterized protein n=1 Tax=Pelotomaculum propionicicum TaxID=258475 RepID=A0A4Y7RM06_9FIRM|nr:hypothetical protein Pmgp_02719 [Pelotomaculum propionicicum]
MSKYYSARCDGYEVTLRLGRISQFKNAILVYINGEVRGEWLLKDCEERRRFFQPVKRSVLSRKTCSGLRKISKKLRQKAGLPDPDAKYTYYCPYWTSFKSLKRHLIKNNDSIELIKK